MWEPKRSPGPAEYTLTRYRALVQSYPSVHGTPPSRKDQLTSQEQPRKDAVTWREAVPHLLGRPGSAQSRRGCWGRDAIAWGTVRTKDLGRLSGSLEIQPTSPCDSQTTSESCGVPAMAPFRPQPDKLARASAGTPHRLLHPRCTSFPSQHICGHELIYASPETSVGGGAKDEGSYSMREIIRNQRGLFY